MWSTLYIETCFSKENHAMCNKNRINGQDHLKIYVIVSVNIVGAALTLITAAILFWHLQIITLYYYCKLDALHLECIVTICDRPALHVKCHEPTSDVN